MELLDTHLAPASLTPSPADCGPRKEHGLRHIMEVRSTRRGRGSSGSRATAGEGRAMFDASLRRQVPQTALSARETADQTFSWLRGRVVQPAARACHPHYVTPFASVHLHADLHAVPWVTAALLCRMSGTALASQTRGSLLPSQGSTARPRRRLSRVGGKHGQRKPGCRPARSVGTSSLASPRW